MIPLALFLLGCAAVYLGSVESAFSALMRLSLRLIVERNGRSGRLGQYLDDPLVLFGPVRLLLGLVVVLATVLIGKLVGAGGAREMGLVIVSGAAFLVVCGHVLPLLIVRREPERVLDSLLPSFEMVARPLRPLTLALSRLVPPKRDRAAAALGEGEPTEQRAAPPEKEGEQARSIEGDERRLLQSIVEFGNTLVREVMTPRPDIVAIAAGSTLDELRQLLREQGYSRVPVFQDNLDNILGFVFVKDLIQVTRDAAGSSPIAAFMRPAHFVPETKRVPELLREFQQQQVQIAIVVDEYGGTAGLVTIEDVLEEIVGEIRDEYDRETEAVTEEGDGVFVFAGKADVDEVADRMGIAIEREGFDTVGGYVLSRLGRVPAVGETFDVDGLLVDVLDAERRRVNKVRMRRRAPAEQPESEQ